MIKSIRQFFCRHRKATWCIKTPVSNTVFFNLSGEQQYLVCDKCGKVLDTRFMPNWDGS